MSDFGRRRFLALAGLCWPERGNEGGCKVLGRGGGEILPIYRLESRVPGRVFEATFRIASSINAGRGSTESTVPLIREVHWRREAEGSTHLRTPMRIIPVLLHATFHFRSDLRREEMTGFADFGGLLGPFTGLAGETGEEHALGEPGVIERAKFRSDLREDGTLASDDDYLQLGGIELWRYKDLAAVEDRPETIEVAGRSWPVRRIELSTPADPRLRLKIELTVWVSDELSLVLREEARIGGELSRTWETLKLDLGANGP